MKKNIIRVVWGKTIFFMFAFLFLFLACTNDLKAASVKEKSEKLKSLLGNKFDYVTDYKTGNAVFLEVKEKISTQEIAKTTKTKRLEYAKRFLDQYGKYFGLKRPSKELSQGTEKDDELGMHHIGFDQMYKGVPVFGGRVITHLGKTGSVEKANGRVLPDVNIKTSPKISAADAQSAALKYFQEEKKSKTDAAKTDNPKLYVFNKNFITNKADGENVLVWEVKVRYKLTEKHGSFMLFYIDAASGALVYKIEGERKALDRAVYYYDPYGDLYYGRTEGQVATGDQSIDNLYDYLGYAHNYLAQRLSRDGANSLGGTGDGYYEDYGVTAGYTNIGYSGYSWIECPNAYFWGDSVAFCDGMIALDTVGHEYGHAINANSVYPNGFTYAGESGSLEEAYADIWGLAIEGYQQGAPDWEMGEDLHVAEVPSPVRNIWNPASNDYGYGPFADKTYATGFYCEDDSFGFYQNSTVLTHAAYLMATGGSFNGCSISPIGSEKQEKIFYRALTNYLTPAATFNDLYYNLISSCNDLTGTATTAADCQEVRKALQAAEMDQAGLCSGIAEKAVPECAISSNVSTLNYSRSKKAKRTISLTLNGASLPKKKYIKVRLNGRNVKVRSARNIATGGLIVLDLKYNKWSVGSYNLLVTYKIKIARKWVTKTATATGILSIVNP